MPRVGRASAKLVILTAVVGGALLAATAFAGETPYFAGNQITSTGYSGWAGTVSYADAPVLAKGGMGGLYGIDWYEDGDQPCHLGTSWRTLTQGTEVYTNGDFDQCAGSPGNRKALLFSDNARYFVRGIAVCSSKEDKNKQRMKGIKLYAAKVWLTKPEVEELTTAIVEEHSNCGTWNGAVFCPANQAATGLIIHRIGRSISALGLRCRPIFYQ